MINITYDKVTRRERLKAKLMLCLDTLTTLENTHYQVMYHEDVKAILRRINLRTQQMNTYDKKDTRG